MKQQSFSERLDAVTPSRVQRVHGESFVFDFSPLGEPFVMTQRHRAAMERLIEARSPIPAMLRAMLNDRLRELAASADSRDLLAKVWKTSGVDAVQVTLGGIELSPSDWDAVVRDAAHWVGRVRASDDMRICTTAAELTHAFNDGKVGIVLGLQDAAPIGKDLERINTLYNFGVRVVQLTFNTRNFLGDGCTEREQSRLSKFGIEVVRRFNELGIIVDVSHSGYATTLDAIETSERPVAITHSSCQAVAAHPRAKSDEQLRALRDRDGYFGVLVVPFFVSPGGGANLEIIVRHVAHAANIVGVERVGIATDWGGWSPDFPHEIQQMARAQLASHGFSQSEMPAFGETIPGFGSWEEWPSLTKALLAHGFSDAEVAGLIGGNWLTFMRRCGL